jgi:hypothetical protein
LRRLIREGFEKGISGEQLAQAAGLSMSRVYQIRDGRRVAKPVVRSLAIHRLFIVYDRETMRICANHRNQSASETCCDTIAKDT